MTQQERICRHIGSDLICLHIDSGCLDEDIRYIKENGITSISLNVEFGFRLDNIDFLKEMPFITELHMGACGNVINFDGLKYVPDLEVLIMDPSRKCKVDLSAQQNLKVLSFEYNPQITGLERLVNLKSLWVWKGSPDFFQPQIFRHYKYLEELHIYYSRPENLLFLKECNLKELVLDHNCKEFSLEGLETQQNLEILKFINCRKATDSERLSSLNRLKTLIVYDSFALPSCHLIQGMTNLESLTLTGSSFFEDGDLRPIEQLIKGLKNNHITQRKHYNLKVTRDTN